MNIVGPFIIAGLFLLSVLVEGSTQNVSKVERFIYDRCRTYSTEASAYDEVQKHLSQFSDYLRFTASLLPNGKEQFCYDEKPRLINLMSALARDLKPCFPKHEKYLPKFMYDVFVEFLNFTCSERNVQNFFSSQGDECRSNMKRNNAGEKVESCFNTAFPVSDDIVKQEELCRDLKSAKSCFGQSIARHCSEFKGYESLNNKFFNAIMKPCNSVVTFGVASMVLTIVAFITTKIF